MVDCLYQDQTGVCGLANLNPESPDTHVSDNNAAVASDGPSPSRIEYLTANCEWLQVLWQLSKRSYSPDNHVLGYYVACLLRHIYPS